ncbi:hypothetical protein M0R04_08290 [Candidatus Dojkabacteria bacterium]|jgi:hypothetical protein|nr:hypothetical protein [Candidatus Dojkabacteria bacterium]
MSKPLSNYGSGDKVIPIIRRRLQERKGGHGYMAALDALRFYPALKNELSKER